MHYIYQVWVENKVTFIISEKDTPTELVDLLAAGGRILDSTVRNNDLGEVIVVRGE